MKMQPTNIKKLRRIIDIVRLKVNSKKRSHVNLTESLKLTLNILRFKCREKTVTTTAACKYIYFQNLAHNHQMSGDPCIKRPD